MNLVYVNTHTYTYTYTLGTRDMFVTINIYNINDNNIVNVNNYIVI